MPAPRPHPRVPFLPQEPLLYKCFSDLCHHRCIHSDNCYLLNYLLLVEERQNRWLSGPCSRPPGSLCLEATPAGGAWVKQGPALLATGTPSQGSWAGCGHHSSHCALGSATLSSSPSPARVCPYRPRRPRGPDSVAATSQRHRDLGFRTSHCLKAGWWHQGLCSSAGVQGRPAGVQSPDWRENNFHL